jgi:hypothetical protein
MAGWGDDIRGSNLEQDTLGCKGLRFEGTEAILPSDLTPKTLFVPMVQCYVSSHASYAKS